MNLVNLREKGGAAQSKQRKRSIEKKRWRILENSVVGRSSMITLI